MSALFSPKAKYTTWRRLWIALAKAEKGVGLPIKKEQILEMEKHLETIDLRRVREIEKETRHDVMAHIKAFAEQCPKASPIIHLGATSAFVTDNGDLLAMRDALRLLKGKLVEIIRLLSKKGEEFASLPTLGYTHLQPAQPTTVGKRLCLYLQDIVIDLTDLLHVEKTLSFLGVKGATGTQASFLSLLNGDGEKVEQLDQLLAKEMGFSELLPLSGQTYTRKQDTRILSLLAGFASSAHKMGTDLRLLAHLGEVEEPLEKGQVGSSAMPHKSNPVRAERVCSLARHLIALSSAPAYTHATQWLERSLDDSAGRRLYLPEAFLTADAIANLLIDLSEKIEIYPHVIKRNLAKELPYLSLETILMGAVKKGKDRQQVHALLMGHARKAREEERQGKEPSSLLERVSGDPEIALSREELEELSQSVTLTGRAEEQVRSYLKKRIEPLLKEMKGVSSPKSPVEL